MFAFVTKWCVLTRNPLLAFIVRCSSAVVAEIISQHSILSTVLIEKMRVYSKSLDLNHQVNNLHLDDVRVSDENTESIVTMQRAHMLRDTQFFVVL